MGKPKSKKKKSKEPPVEPEVTADEVPADDTEGRNDTTPGPSVEDAAEEIERLKNEKEDVFDQLLRLKAEFENYKKRTFRDVQDRIKRAEETLLKDLLPVLDSFDRAFDQPVPQDDAAAVLDGLNRIRQQFHDVLIKAGLEMVDSVGTKFDPNIHEALFTVPTDEHEENTVVAELERGYAVHGKIIRPTKVSVSVAKETEEEEKEADAADGPDANGS